MKWLITAILFFVGLTLLDHHTGWGLAIIALAVGIIWMAVVGKRKNTAVHVYRPQHQPTAAVEVDAQRRAAERNAKRMVQKARRDAEIEGRNAVAAAEARIASEPKWVA